MSSNDPGDLRPQDQGFDPEQAPREPAKPLDPAMDDAQPVRDPFAEADAAAAPHPPDVQFPAGTAETIFDESPEAPATADPAQVRDDLSTTGTGSSIAIGCVAVAIVIVLIVVLVLTIVS